MRTLPRSVRSHHGFTLVEMIGVLSVISILSSLMVPRVFLAISDARLNNAAASYNGIKAAVNEYYGHYAKIGGTNGTDLGLGAGNIYEDWDLRCLVTEGFAEKPFVVRLGNELVGSASQGSRIRIINISANTADTRPASTPLDLDAGAYNLDGGSVTNDVTGGLLIEAVIEGVSNADAMDLNDRIDGPVLGAAVGANDESGRLKYLLGVDGTASVHLYLAHR